MPADPAGVTGIGSVADHARRPVLRYGYIAAPLHSLLVEGSEVTLSAGARLGPYEILAPLGAGGMGEVYRARDPRLGRDVAIKVLPASFSQRPRPAAPLRAGGARGRRPEPPQHPGGLRHRRRTTARPYIVTELLEGETLRARLWRGGALPVRKAIDYAIQIAHGLAAAHEKGIVHRDLKPENLFVTNDGRVKILDFGLAKLDARRRVADGQTNLPDGRRAPSRASCSAPSATCRPSRCAGQPADPRSDIFAFGAILYEMLSGQRAFHGDSAADTMTAILREDPPDLSVTNQNVPPGLERIVRHCLEKNPEERFQSARDLAFDLEALSGLVHAPDDVDALAAADRAVAFLPLADPIADRRRGRRGFLRAGAWRAGSPRRPRRSSSSPSAAGDLDARFAPDGQTSSTAPRWRETARDRSPRSPTFPESRPIGLTGVRTARGLLAGRARRARRRPAIWAIPVRRNAGAHAARGGAPARGAGGRPPGGLVARRQRASRSSATSAGRDRLEYPIGKVLCETAAGSEQPAGFSRRRADRVLRAPDQVRRPRAVAVVDLAGKKTVLSDGYWGEEGLAWSPDGSEVMFSAGNAWQQLQGVRRDARRAICESPSRAPAA